MIILCSWKAFKQFNKSLNSFYISLHTSKTNKQPCTVLDPGLNKSCNLLPHNTYRGKSNFLSVKKLIFTISSVHWVKFVFSFIRYFEKDVICFDWHEIDCGEPVLLNQGSGVSLRSISWKKFEMVYENPKYFGVDYFCV